MSQETQKQTESTPIMQQIGMLNLRINDMMTQLNATLKAMMEENKTLKQENTELKEKQEKTGKP
jgi:regulator of replication initiation timing